MLKVNKDKSIIGASRFNTYGHLISSDDVQSNMPMPTDIKQLCSLLGDFSYYRKFLRPTMSLPKNGDTFKFTSTMQDTVYALLAELAASPIIVCPDWDALPMNPDPFTSTPMLALPASEPFSKKNNAMAPYPSLSTSAERLSQMGKTRLLLNSKLEASRVSPNPNLNPKPYPLRPWHK